MIGATGWVVGGGSVRLDMLKHGREDTGIVRDRKPAFQHPSAAPCHARMSVAAPVSVGGYQTDQMSDVRAVGLWVGSMDPYQAVVED